MNYQKKQSEVKMEDIELVVKIPKEIYNHTQEYEIGGFNQENDTKLFIAIKNGTPLPKGHGKMIDAVEYSIGIPTGLESLKFNKKQETRNRILELIDYLKTYADWRE